LSVSPKVKATPPGFRGVFAEFYREHYGSELPLATVGAYCEKWLALKKVETGWGLIPGTRKSFLGSSAQDDLGEVSKTQIIAFRDWCLPRYAPGSVNLTLWIIKMMFRAARLEG